MRLAPLFFLLLAACPKAPPPPPPPAPVAAPVDWLAERPVVGAPAAWAPANPVESKLGNGLTVWRVSDSSLPLVSLSLVLEGGSARDPLPQPGLTALADTLILHGAGARKAAAFAEEAERLAIFINVATQSTSTVVTLRCEAARLDEGLALLADAVLRPRFDKDAVSRLREMHEGEISQELDEPRILAQRAALAAWYGADHPLGHAPLGTVAGIQKADAAALKKSWTARANPHQATMVVAGAVDGPALEAALQKHLGAWSGKPAPVTTTPPRKGKPGARIFVDTPGASQSVLRVVMSGWSGTDAGLEAGRLGSIVLGGTFTSRLNRLLREEKGYTYGASARLEVRRKESTMTAASSVKADVTDEALVDLLGVLKAAKSGERPITEEERIKSAGARRQDLVEAMSARDGVAGTYAELAALGLPADALAKGLVASQGQSAADINAALQGLDLDGALIVVVGDLKTIRADVEAKVPGAWTVVKP